MLFDCSIVIRRSKTQAGHRAIPLNTDAVAALAQLRRRADAHSADAPEHFVFPACERNRIDPTRPQKDVAHSVEEFGSGGREAHRTNGRERGIRFRQWPCECNRGLAAGRKADSGTVIPRPSAPGNH
jgi:hypothetical protein